MIFWHDGHSDSTRIKNVEFSWPELKNLCSFLRENGFNCDHKLYDFSVIKQFEDAIHVPYDTLEFKKAEKLNHIIKSNLQYDYLVMFDCDMFFFKKDYDKVLTIFKNVTKRTLTTFDAAKLHINHDIVNDENFNPYDHDWSYAYSGNKENGPLSSGRLGGLGGIYICDMELLKEIEFFDENFTRWGGEDGDLLNKIYYLNNTRIIPVREFAPFHLPHFSDWNNPNYR